MIFSDMGNIIEVKNIRSAVGHPGISPGDTVKDIETGYRYDCLAGQSSNGININSHSYLRKIDSRMM